MENCVPLLGEAGARMERALADIPNEAGLQMHFVVLSARTLLHNQFQVSNLSVDNV